MSHRWEEMTAHQKLSTLRSEIESLGRVVDSVAGRIDKLKGELRIIQSQLDQSAGDKVRNHSDERPPCHVAGAFLAAGERLPEHG
jgi:uncharacterized coiled-coil protein SlyX